MEEQTSKIRWHTSHREQKILKEIGAIEEDETSILRLANQSALILMKNPIIHSFQSI